MIAEAIELSSGTVAVTSVVALVCAVGGGAWWASAAWSLLKRIERDQGTTLREMRAHARALDDHKAETAAQTTELGHRVTRLEIERELAGDRTPVQGIPIDRPSTGKHDRLRGNTPQPRKHADSGDTDSGMR